jgi:hypothetical protein
MLIGGKEIRVTGGPAGLFVQNNLIFTDINPQIYTFGYYSSF